MPYRQDYTTPKNQQMTCQGKKIVGNGSFPGFDPPVGETSRQDGKAEGKLL
jgi:hypothetical protein